MKTIWHSEAKAGRRQVATYIYKWFGIKRLKRFRHEVDDVVKMILRHPNIGPIDPLYADRPDTYRSIIINGLSKLVYRVDDDTIHIVGFWDTRQEPTSQAAQTE